MLYQIPKKFTFKKEQPNKSRKPKNCSRSLPDQEITNKIDFFFNENPRKIKKQAYPCRKRDSWLISWPFIMAAEKSQNRLKRDTK